MDVTRFGRNMWVFALAAPLCIRGQTLEKKDLFSRPTTALICESAKSDSTEVGVGLLEFQFDEDTPEGRTITVGYQADGTPRTLLVVASHLASSGKLTMEMAGVGFNRTVPNVGFHAWKDPDSTSIVPQREDLTPDQIAKARELAVWLWAKRCVTMALAK